jgi:hypothetical protein
MEKKEIYDELILLKKRNDLLIGRIYDTMRSFQ